METQCPKCEGTVKTIPAGTSKTTGKPYTAFQVCENKECGWATPRDFPKKTSGYVAQHTAKMEDVRAANIKVAQERKEESITKLNALNCAISLICHHELYKLLTDEELILKKIFELQKRFYTHNNQPFI